MATTSVDQVTGYGETVAYKAPCRLATTANITLSGLQAIDGTMTAVDDRVLVKNQTTGSQNGIYIAATGPWQRARDMDSNRDLTKGTRVNVTDGTANGGREYYVSSSNPITVGTTNLVFTEALSSNAGASAAAAAASASAAAASASAASTSAANAASSASSASTSASSASTSATNAASSATTASTQATNASNSASAASGSASSASTSATNAGNSATAASGSASAAASSATAASTSATNAATSETNAAVSATAAANSIAALGYTYSTTTADADPGNGTLRLNNATTASATAAYIDNLDASGATVTGILDAIDDSTNTVKGQLTLRSKASASIAYVYNVTGSVVDGTGYRKLTLSYISGSGSLPTTTNGIWLIFDRTGDKGADGAGTGDFSGPASSVTDNIVTFASTTGKAGKDSGVAVSSLAPKASPALTGTPTAPTAAAGTNSTQIATTAYVDTTFAPKASPTFTGTPAAPTASAGTNTTQIATTAFVKAAIDVVLGGVSSAFDTLSEIVASMVRKDADTTLTAGYFGTDVSDGTKSSGTYTPSPAGGNFRSATNNGAHTLAAPSASGSYSLVIDYTNGATAGAITTSGFTKVTGDAFTTTNGNKFRLFVSKGQGGTHLHVQALQ
ncbi:hypothetical protein [Mesorhizobium sp.]|uniref:hypothetical protein n=1 Tax=Mesorhizobium sp. TaxID=1871066 RepID=UPI0012219374|nr:hypothetical protein [Mesorhizobium sp.]TIQ95482.1 MAG: hypothetical protein E5X36_21790 [Mesorhizobium sp.]